MNKGKAYKPVDLGPSYWRDIPGYDGKYQVSRAGDFRRVFHSGLVRDLHPYKKSGVKGRAISRDSLYVKLTKDGNGKAYLAHQIVSELFLGPCPPEKVIYHKNFIVTDNHAENLAFIARRDLARLTGFRTKNRKAVLKIDRSGEIVEAYRSARAAGKANYMSYQAVLDRCNNKIKDPWALDGFNYQWERD